MPSHAQCPKYNAHSLVVIDFDFPLSQWPSKTDFSDLENIDFISEYTKIKQK